VHRVLVVLLLATLACGGGGGPVGDARRVLDDDDRFATSYEAGDALATVGGRLLEAGKACHGGCDALLSASAFAQVLAVRVLDCTAPGRFAIRAAMRAYLDEVDDLDDDATAPEPPDAPTCT
jgi:hypothetical protein